jgi:hypothetical protein
VIRQCGLALLLVVSAAMAAPPQPDEEVMDRARERLGVYIASGIQGGEVVSRMRSWFGYEFEGVPDASDPAVIELYLVRRDSIGNITFRARVGFFR